jgi:hypothetical protein
VQVRVHPVMPLTVAHAANFTEARALLAPRRLGVAPPPAARRQRVIHAEDMTARRSAAAAGPAAGNGCTGTSTFLPTVQCAAWQAFYDGAGGDGWVYFDRDDPSARFTARFTCTRGDPCACVYGTYRLGVTCNPSKTAVTGMYVCHRRSLRRRARTLVC